MSLHRVSSAVHAREHLPAGAPAAVVVPVYDAVDDAVRCYRSVLTWTPPEVPLVVVDDGSKDRRVVDVLDDELAQVRGERVVVVVVRAVNGGFVAAANDGLTAAGDLDVALVNSDVVVGPQWFERLREAAHSAGTVASATALTNHGTILSVPVRNAPGPVVACGGDVEAAARAVARGAARSRGRIPTMVGHCVYLRRDALRVVGAFDPAFSPGYGEEVDWSLRAAEAGFEHVVADDVFVEHRAGATFGQGMTPGRRAHEALVDQRYPYYGHLAHRASRDDTSLLAAAVLAARRSMLGLRVAIDAMVLHPTPTGTQIGILETVRAIAGLDGVTAVDVLVRHHVPDYAQAVLGSLPEVRLVPTDVGEPVDVERADVVFRPYQVTSVEEVRWLRGLGERLVVNQLDLIAYNNPGYFLSDGEWLAYRDAQRLALACADGVAFISEHSRASARDAGLLPAGRPTAIVFNGVEHYAHPDLHERAVAPAGLDEGLRGALLVLGVPYKHKNRVFALELLRRLDADGWQGSLVLAGPTPTCGDTVPAEQEWLAAHPELADRVLDVGKVTEAEKVWLYRHCGLVVYPTTSEGFGLIPFEAAGMGVPCLTTRQGGLDEVLPPGLPVIEGWDVDKAAALARTLLADEEARTAWTRSVVDFADRFTWPRTADLLLGLFQEVTGRAQVATTSVRGEDGAPVSLVPSAGSDPSVDRRRAAARRVTRLARNPRLRAALGPAGSTRDRLARRVAARLRG